MGGGGTSGGDATALRRKPGGMAAVNIVRSSRCCTFSPSKNAFTSGSLPGTKPSPRRYERVGGTYLLARSPLGVVFAAGKGFRPEMNPSQIPCGRHYRRRFGKQK